MDFLDQMRVADDDLADPDVMRGAWPRRAATLASAAVEDAVLGGRREPKLRP